MVIGELVPKNFALALPLATAKVVVPFQTLFTTVFKPVIVLFNNSANAIIRSFGIEPKEELSGARSAEELSSLVRRSAAEGVLDQDHATLLHRTLRFSDHTRRRRDDPAGADGERRTARHGASEIVSLATADRLLPLPGHRRDRDDVVGVVHVKQAFAVPRSRPARGPGVRRCMIEPLRVPESMGVDTLLGQLRRQGFQMAVVVDEYGGTAGVVTLEDLVEELVGEVDDEHDRARAGVVRTGRSLTFDAALRPDELLDRTGSRCRTAGSTRPSPAS